VAAPALLRRVRGVVVSTRGALRYYGGKVRLAPWIAGHFPPHACYVEPFCGALSVLLHKAPARFEVANDLDGEVVNFFRVLRDRPEDFRRAVELTPYARAEVDLACDDSAVATATPLERARRFYVRSWQSIHGAPSRGRMGWRYEKGGARGWSRTVTDAWAATGHLLEIAARLKAVQLECDDALRVIARFDAPGTLFYVDPPYVASTRSERWATAAYAHEMTDAQHTELAGLLRGLAGMVVLSGYPSPLYAGLYPDWERVERRATVQGAGTATEALWLSPRTVEAFGRRQLSFSVEAAG
jgi:DNA adenine methylase